MIMLGEELPSLSPPDGLSLIFIIQIFEQLSCSEKQNCLKLFTVLKYFFIFQDFWATYGLPWKAECALNSLYWIYIFLIIQNFEQLAHAPKNRVSLKFFTALKYFYLSGFLRKLRLSWKQSLSWNFSLYLIYFLHSGCLSNCCLPWKTKCALNSLYWMYFHPSEFWTTCACPEKQSLPWKFSLHWNKVFEELALALKTKFSLKFFTVLYIVFTFRIFEQLVRSLKNRVCPEFTVLNIYFLSFRILNNLRLPWKQNLPWNFSLYWNIFYLSGFLSNLSLPWKQSLPWIFQTGGRPPPSPPRTPVTTGIPLLIILMMSCVQFLEGSCL